jgi:hypothetical protein
MGFRFRKRINLGKGFGLNLSSAGLSGSYRSRMGSVGTRGFSIRTGIPGFTYTQRWSKGSSSGKVGGCSLLVIIGLVTAIIILLVTFFGSVETPQPVTQ